MISGQQAAKWLKTSLFPWLRRKRDLRFYHVAPFFAAIFAAYFVLDHVHIDNAENYAGVWRSSSVDATNSYPYRMYLREKHS